MKPFIRISNIKLFTIISVFLIIFDNATFFNNVLKVYPPTFSNILFIISLTLVLILGLVTLFSLVCWRFTTKPILSLILLVSAVACYYMNSYNIIIDAGMLQNITHTDVNEIRDLLSFKLVLYILLLGILPTIILYKIKIAEASLKKEITSRSKVIGLLLLLILPTVWFLGNYYASFIREHKALRYYTNPTGYLYAIVKYANLSTSIGNTPIETLGDNAKISPSDIDRELIILVVGEAVRVDRFSLNGYSRKTNPLLEQEDIINFPNFYSCGTSTAVSVPCMFSIYGREEFTHRKADSTENVLDVLSHAGVNILWRDNNSDSKEVATRVKFEDFKTDLNNPVCDTECRDEGMLHGLDEYINNNKKGDILIILHQMGNHGPAYYKRYPKSFEKFIPVCFSNQLEQCSKDKINNSYDNAILYTDFFLSKVINFLKPYSKEFETAMFYISDHGESLGESGLYLHGLPYMIAPNTQKHVAALMWLGDNFDIEDKEALKKKSTQTFSHDNIFHTLLGLMEVEDPSYNRELDILKGLH